MTFLQFLRYFKYAGNHLNVGKQGSMNIKDVGHKSDSCSLRQKIKSFHQEKHIAFHVDFHNKEDWPERALPDDLLSFSRIKTKTKNPPISYIIPFSNVSNLLKGSAHYSSLG